MLIAGRWYGVEMTLEARCRAWSFLVGQKPAATCGVNRLWRHLQTILHTEYPRFCLVMESEERKYPKGIECRI